VKILKSSLVLQKTNVKIYGVKLIYIGFQIMCGTIIGVNIKMKKKDIIKSLKFAKRMNEFVSYVYDFYGKNGIYDMGATVSQIQTATIHYIGSDDSLPFYGDSLDRERVRDILTSKFNLKEVI